MSDSLSSQHWPENEHIIRRMQDEIDRNLGEGAWNELTSEGAPTSNMNNVELSRVTRFLIKKFDERVPDGTMANRIFCQVRHGLTRADFKWAREKFMQYGDIDVFANAVLTEQLEELKDHMQKNKPFYGQSITREVYDFVSGIPNLFYGKRHGNKILADAIPFNALDYIQAKDDKTKRYAMCHCQFARESILSGSPVSKTLCYCSLGHNLVFWEAALDTELKGDVLSSALGGDLSCKFVIYLTDELMNKYINT